MVEAVSCGQAQTRVHTNRDCNVDLPKNCGPKKVVRTKSQEQEGRWKMAAFLKQRGKWRLGSFIQT